MSKPVPLGRTAQWLAELLRPHTPFAEAIVRRQAERAGLSVATMSDADLKRIIALVLAASGPFVDPPALAAIRRALDEKSRLGG
jgi:hypothetical protein